MSAIELYESPATVAVSPQTHAVRRLHEWAESAQAASQIAAELVRTSFVPESFRGKPYEATAAILAGLEVGLQPMAALRAFDVIQGQAAPRALTLRAVAQSQGHEIVMVESTGTRCRMKGRRNGTAEWQEVVWTLDRAKALNLTGKPNWRNQPQAMLVARATSEIARLVAADAILGLGYSAEEVADGGPAGYGDVTDGNVGEAAATPATAGGTRRMSRQQVPAPAELEAETTPDAGRITDAQRRKMMAQFGELGIKDKPPRIARMVAIIGREVESGNDLTLDEARTVIDALDADLAEFHRGFNDAPEAAADHDGLFAGDGAA